MNAVLNELSENVPEVVKGDSKVAIMQKAVQYIKVCVRRLFLACFAIQLTSCPSCYMPYIAPPR